MSSTESASPDDLLLRPAVDSDVATVVGVYLDARRHAEPAMPPVQHSDDGVRHWIEQKLQGSDDTWVAEVDGSIVGYVRATPTWLDDLYVAPSHQRSGVGTALLDLVKAMHPDGFRLWVFESNTGARGFYARHGLIELQTTDGSANEERSPDIMLAWPGERPLDFLRACIDEVDDDLASVLQARAVLTAAVQRYKPTPGAEGRDREREQEIAERIATRAPQLGAERIQRIVHTVISESLEAAQP